MDDHPRPSGSYLPVVHFVIDPSDVERLGHARRLAAELDLPVVSPGFEPPEGLLLCISARGLELREATSPGLRGVRVDLHTLALRSGRGHLSRRQPLVRALGRGTHTVLDATAGLARDSTLLALMGFDVSAVERNPVIAALVRDGLERARVDPRLSENARERFRTHLRITTADARDLLPVLETPPDAIYIDPMFPPKRKPSALARKSIRLVGRLVGTDEDAGELLAAARATAAARVVVKRPSKSQPIGGAPTVSIDGKLVRYDVYVAPGGSSRDSV